MPRKKRRLSLEERIQREKDHADKILAMSERAWGWSGPAGSIRKQRRLRFLAAPTGKVRRVKALEIGSGTGNYTEGLVKEFHDLTGLEIAEQLIEVSRRRCPTATFVNRDAHATKFPTGHFDLIVGCSVLHHLDWEVALREIHRILKPGGHIRFSEPNLLNPQIFLQKNWPWLKKKMGDSPCEYAFTAAHIKSLLAKIGFVDVQVKPFEFLHPATPAALIPIVLKLESLLEKSPLGAFGGSLLISARK